MKNTLLDLNNHLFEQLERLNDEDLTGQELMDEIDRSRAISKVADAIIRNASLALDAQEFIQDYSRTDPVLPEMLEIKHGK